MGALLDRPADMQATGMINQRGAQALLRGRRTLHAALLRATPRRRPPLTILINLDGSTVRRAKMNRTLETAGMRPWARLPALYGTNVHPEAMARAGLLRSALARNNVGSALSHLAAWRFLAAANTSALVLEDDALLPSRFRERLGALLRATGERFDLLHLSYFDHLTAPRCVHPLAVRTLPPTPGRAPAAPRVAGPPMPAPAGWGEALAAKLVQLRCPRGINPSVTAYVMTAAGAARALPLAVPLGETVDLQLGTRSASLRWLALRPHEALARHDWGLRSIRVHGLPPNVQSRQ